MTPVVIDERSTRPLRAIFGELLVGAGSADIAIGRIRLAALDLAEAEVRGPGLCRVLLGQLDASTLLDAASQEAGPSASFGRLADWLASDRLEVRSAGIGAWTPDFSVFRDRDGTATCLVGAHYFESRNYVLDANLVLRAKCPDPTGGAPISSIVSSGWV